MTKKPIRAAVYLRQSQDRTGDEQAITRQREDCLALCEQKGWEPTEYVDNDVSASNGKTRPAYERMLRDIEANKLDAVACWDLDRLHRRPIELETFIDLADRHKLALATVTGECDLSTHNGRLDARIKGSVARAEMDQKSERQKRAALQRAESGTQWWSVRPFGFRYAEGKPVLDDDGRPTLDPIEAAEIRAAYSVVLAGSSCYSIVADWNSRAVLTPRGNKWRGSQVRQLLVSPRNAGLREYTREITGEDGKPVRRKDIVGPGGWPAIVDESTWRGVTGKLSDPSRHYGPSRARRHLLSNLAQCGAEGCGARMGSGVNSRGALIYTCKSCNRNSRNGAWLDALVIEHVVDRLSRDDAADLIVDAERPDIAALTEQRDALREQQAALGVRHANGEVSLSFAEAADKRFTEQIEALSALITNDDEAEIYADVIGSDADARFAALDLSRQRRIVNSLLDITVRPSGRCGRVFKREDVDVLFKGRNS
jgi:DNA invertase Pin-like site-specific DNA recombinase